MKLAFINFYSGYASRGGETYVDALASRLSQTHQVTPIQAGPIDSLKPYKIIQKYVSYNPQHSHISLSVTHPLKRLFLDYSHLKELIFTLKIIPDILKLRPDYILPQNSGWEVFLLTVISRLTGIKIIISGQSGPGWNDRVNLFFRPDVFVALTTTQAVWARKATLWKNQKIVVIPNGVDLDQFRPKGQKQKLNLPKPVIISVGAAINSKRIKETIKAVSTLKKGSLLVVGTGPNEKQEDVLASSVLGNRYKRLNVDYSTMPSLYRSADLFTLCSDKSEAFGIAYLEAMASGLPVVATDDPPRHEIVGESGLFVKNPLDSMEYSSKLKQALVKNWSGKPRRQAGKFSWDIISTRYQDLLKNAR